MLRRGRRSSRCLNLRLHPAPPRRYHRGVKLTPQQIAALAKPGERRELVDDSGLRVRASAAGAVSYSYVYRVPLEGVPARSRPQRRLVLGTHPEMSLAKARQAVEAARVRIGRGDDPQPPRARPAEAVVAAGADPADEHERRILGIVGAEVYPGSVAELVVSYLRLHVLPNLRPWPAWRGLEQALRLWIVPAWGRRPVASLGPADLVNLLGKIRAAGARGRTSNATGNRVLANRVQSYAHGLMSFAALMQIRRDNPFAGMRRSRDRREKPRERTLDTAEIRALWEYLARPLISPQVRAALRLVLLTGQRPGDVCAMLRADVRRQWWRREFKGSRLATWLCPAAVLEIQAVRERRGFTTYVFPAVRREGALSVHSLSQAMERACEALRIPRATPHDLRRTCARWMEELGVAESVVDRGVLGHVVSSRSARPYLQARLEGQAQSAWACWEAAVLRAVRGREIVEPAAGIEPATY